MTVKTNSKIDISAFALRTLAIVCMLLDHIGYCLPKAAFSPVFRIIGRPAVFSLPSAWTMKEAIALLALIPIFFYHGTKGFTPKSKIAAKALQIGFYAFYPVHMLLLWLILK